MTKKIEVRKPTEADQPGPGGFCDICGHFAMRHDKNGCNGTNPELGCRFGGTEAEQKKCEVMVWGKVKWPEPWNLESGYDQASWRRFALKELREKKA